MSNRVSKISPSPGLRFAGMHKGLHFKPQLNIPSRIMQSFLLIQVILGWDEGKGKDR